MYQSISENNSDNKTLPKFSEEETFFMLTSLYIIKSNQKQVSQKKRMATE